MHLLFCLCWQGNVLTVIMQVDKSSLTKCSGDGDWETMIFLFFSLKNGCCDKWDVCIYSLVNTVFCAVKMNVFPYCFLARNDASCSHPPYSLPSVSDAFGQIDRLHFSR